MRQITATERRSRLNQSLRIQKRYDGSMIDHYLLYVLVLSTRAGQPIMGGKRWVLRSVSSTFSRCRSCSMGCVARVLTMLV